MKRHRSFEKEPVHEHASPTGCCSAVIRRALFVGAPMIAPRASALPEGSRVAVIGSGIAGLSAARRLTQSGLPVTLFEANEYLGGHTHTVEVTLDGRTAPVDTGFLVYNDRTYPNLIRLFAELGVESAVSEMSFSLRNDAEHIEWAGTNLRSLFAQPSNLVRPAFWRMLRAIARFNRAAKAVIAVPPTAETLGQHIERNGYGREFREWYLVPMAAAIWSSPQAEILDFPFASFARFCDNHGLLQVVDRPQWRTVVGGAREYVRRIAADLTDVRLATPVRSVRRSAQGVDIEFIEDAQPVVERFGQVVFACHSDQTLRLLAEPSHAEQRLLSAVRYQPNRVLLHTDRRLMPRSRAAWSAWNHLAAPDPDQTRPVAVTYWLNKLQPLPFATPLFVTLNPPFEPAAETVLGEFEYDHPLHDRRAVAAQAGFAALQGAANTYYCGAWLGYGFHEDGLKSGLAAADAVLRDADVPATDQRIAEAVAA